MQQFLASHGIAANVKYFGKGSVRGWRLYNSELQWTAELIAQLTALGFRHYDGEPLDRFDGNGGVFSVFVCGHEELLQEVQS
jgi:hypothetical protein